MFLRLLYVTYWIILGAVIWHSEKKIAWLEEENRHLKELVNIEKMREKEWRKELKMAKNAASKV